MDDGRAAFRALRRVGWSVGISIPPIAVLLGLASALAFPMATSRWMPSALFWLLFIVLAVAAAMDLRWRRIPNWLTYPAHAGAALLIAGQTLMDWNWVGETTASSHLCGFALGFAVVFAVYLFSGFGGGDVKLVGVVGLCVGFPRILECLLWTYGLASGLTLAYVLVRYGVRATATGSLAGPRAAGAAGAVGRIRIPMAPFFLLGCAVESFRDRLI